MHEVMNTKKVSNSDKLLNPAQSLKPSSLGIEGGESF